ncbi:MAG: hypothetical protein P9F75_14470 [Candidatus Contendobacter sp.]|nr:hypothetical protein [Candidatus Contendobacter sp.]MDG4558243.1 hypothetical protein [Candidatus Contendobacter sp.]MDG4596867.1 hypothetical protein [Candidatus Contendobacter sp.]
MNRRTFLVAMTYGAGIALGGQVSLGMAAGPATKGQPPGPKKALPSLGERFSYDSLKAHVGETFSVYGGPGLRKVVNLKLVAVEGLRRDKKTEQFAARFLGPADDPLPSGVYQFQHLTSGEFQLLIGPTGKTDAKGRYYQAIFNLLR